MRVNIQNKNTSFIWILILYSILSITPIADQLVSPVLLPLIFGLMLLFVVHRERIIFSKGVSLFIILFFILDLLYHILGISERIGNAITRFLFFGAIIIYLYLKDNFIEKEKKMVFFTLLFIIVINIVDNIRLNAMYPLASILAIKQGESYRGLNIGTTMFNTMSLLFYVVCFFMLINTKKIRDRLIYASMCVAAFIYIFYYGMRGSVVTILFIITLLMLLVRFVGKYKILWLLVPLLIVPIANPNFIFDLVSGILPEGRLVDRLDDIQNVTQEGVDDASLSGRVYFYKVSLETWSGNLSNFLFGIGEHRASAMALGNDVVGVGGHSEFIDILARWGAVGAIVVIVIFVKYYWILIAQTNDKQLRNQARILYLALLLCGFFKSIFSSYIGIVSFILMPLAVWMIDNERN